MHSSQFCQVVPIAPGQKELGVPVISGGVSQKGREVEVQPRKQRAYYGSKVGTVELLAGIAAFAFVLFAIADMDGIIRFGNIDEIAKEATTRVDEMPGMAQEPVQLGGSADNANAVHQQEQDVEGSSLHRHYVVRQRIADASFTHDENRLRHDVDRADL